MKSILRALALTGILGLGAAAAQAQVRFGVRIGVPAPVVVAAIPPCPGVGYVWVPGYYAGAVWVPGAWGYRGAGYGYGRVAVGGDWHGGYAHGYYAAGRDFHGYAGYHGGESFRGRR